MGSLTVRVEKATSRLLSGPDWAMNVDICDSINSDHRQAKDVVKAVKKRLRNKKPKVQLLALTLLEMMIKNCGDYMHFQVVERNILQEMTKIIRKKTDMHVRDKILGLLNSWQQAFGGPGGKYPQYFWAYDELRDIYSTMPRGRDIAWEHMTSVDGSTSRVRCNYCHHEMSGGATRMKEHLLGRRGEVVPCLRIPRAIQDHIRSEVGDKSKVKASAKARTSTEAHDDDAKARTSTQAHDEDRELEIVLQLSRQEAELQKRQAALEEEEMELAIQRSLQDPWRYGQGSSSRFSGGPIIRDPPSSSSRYQPYPYQTHSDSDSST